MIKTKYEQETTDRDYQKYRNKHFTNTYNREYQEYRDFLREREEKVD